MSPHQTQLIDDLLIIPDVQERMSAVVAAAAKQGIPEAEREDAWLVSGCSSRVWVAGFVTADTLHLRSDADSPLVKGLVHLLCQVYDGQPIDQVRADRPELWEKLGFHKMLSPTRQNGLAAVHRRVVELAAE
jgi:cysteine desulfuration protein SufE